MIFRKYVYLTKPGIVFGNLISVAGGFFLASRGSIDLALFLATISGVSLVVASGCVFNNFIDRDIDQRMARTKNRALVQGSISSTVALVYASALGLAGIALLYGAVNALSAILALVGFVIYVGVYSLYAKRHTVHGTIIGSLSGASPPVIGYCAVSNRFDLGALLLLVIFSLWQMPHSYAIAIFRFNDYSAASIPVLPVSKGIRTARKHIVGYIVAFILATLMLTLSGYTGYFYFAVAALMGGYWLMLALSGYKAADDQAWARKIFVFSIFIITALSIMMSLDFRTDESTVLLTQLAT